MELMLDTANLNDIKNYLDIYPISGVTSNPSILKKEGRINVFDHLNQIRNIIGMDKSLHVQVVTSTCENMIKEAYKICEKIDKSVYIKIPVNEEGLKAIKTLKQEGYYITATAIYTKMQGDLAILAGADYIAPYVNRMENISINSEEVIAHFAHMIKEYNYDTKILAASFKNSGQLTNAYEWGAHSVTVDPVILHDALNMPSISKAVEDFRLDFEQINGENISFLDL
jgi:transaldolase